MRYAVYILLAGLICWAGCKKSEDPNKNDPRLSANTYCNDPRAVNYNWNFPGVADNTTCFFPFSVFQGTYLFTDSVMDANYHLTYKTDTIPQVNIYTIILTRIDEDYNKMLVQGLHICKDTNDVLSINAGRFFKAFVDSTRRPAPDTTFFPGQILGHCADTVTGFFTKEGVNDTVLHINLTVYNDTGVIYHIGTAKKL